MKLEITTPGKLIYKADIEQATLPGELGEFGVLPGHAPLISTLKIGVINIVEQNKTTHRVFVAGGFVEVNQTECSVLATEAYDLASITKEEAQGKLDKATIRLKVAENDIERNLAQIQINVFEALVQAI